MNTLPSIHENLAERLFVDLRNKQIKISNPIYIVEGAKIGQYPNAKQLVIWGINDKYAFGFGSSVDMGSDTPLVNFTVAYQDLFDELSTMSKRGSLQFISLILPKKAVVDARLDEFNDKVISRFLKVYIPERDEVASRWDVLVQAA